MDGRPDIFNTAALPPSMTFVLRNLFVEDGRAYVAAFDPNEARFIGLSPVLVQGGGPEDYVYTPPIHVEGATPRGIVDNAEERQLVLLRREGKIAAQVACVAHPLMKLAEAPPEPADDEDHAATIAKQDFALRRAGVKAFVDARGALVIDTRDSTSKVVRLQLPSDGVLRVSRDGDATERTVLAGPALDYMEQVNQFLQDVQSWAAGLVVNTTGSSTAQTGGPAVPFTSTPPVLDRGALTAATLHIANDSEASP